MKKYQYLLAVALLFPFLFAAGPIVSKVNVEEAPICSLSSAYVAPVIALPGAGGSLNTSVWPRKQEALSPEVEAFIAGTYLAHSEEYPDPNEPLEVLRLYLEGQELLRQGQTEQALVLFTQLVHQFPQARHAHAGLGSALWQRYENSKELEDLEAAVREFLKAAQIGMQFGKVRYTYRIAIGLGILRDSVTMDQFFAQALAVGNRKYLTSLDYARGLSTLGDPRAEEWFKQAIALRPTGNVDAIAYYAEWLLDHNRPKDVITLIDPDAHVEYLHFLRGVALERLGKLEEAYAAYQLYAPLSILDPAPAKYRIPGSKAQAGITFKPLKEGVTPHSVPPECDGYNSLAVVIECEAAGESEGGQRAVGWTVRTRVFRGTLPGCVYVDNSGSTLSCKYDSVIYQPYQFYTNCGRTPGPTPRHVRYDVWYGKAPDPTTGYCPYGSYSGDPCSGSVHCTWAYTYGASSKGPMRFYSTSGTCPSGGEYSCLTAKGKICGNGGSDHCFYNRP